jgi:hypothetical protein
MIPIIIELCTSEQLSCFPLAFCAELLLCDFALHCIIKISHLLLWNKS